MRRLLVALGLTAALASNLALAVDVFVKGTKLVSEMTEYEKVTRKDATADLFIAGAFAGFVIGVADTTDGVCTPRGATIGDLASASAAYLKRNTPDLEKPGVILVARALREAYPCPTSAPPAAPITSKPRSTSVPPPPSSNRRAVPSTGCESGHWIDSVSEDGEIIKLEDGSIWEVDAGDSVTSSLWLATTDVLVCESKGKLINTDDNETVTATRLK